MCMLRLFFRRSAHRPKTLSLGAYTHPSATTPCESARETVERIQSLSSRFVKHLYLFLCGFLFVTIQTWFRSSSRATTQLARLRQVSEFSSQRRAPP